jgi:conjugal transfer/entry exclusion protein
MAGIVTPRLTADRARFLQQQTEILQQLAAMQAQLDTIAADVDAIDRHLRPYGDGTKVTRRPRPAALRARAH